MSESLEIRAEVAKIAGLLDVDPVEIEYLRRCDRATLSAFRDRVTDHLFGGGSGRLRRFARPLCSLPSGIVSRIVREAVGPVLTARVAGLVDPQLAIDVSRRLPPQFLADVAQQADPRLVGEVIAGVPAELVADVTAIMLERGAYVTMGRFVPFLEDEAIKACLDHADDDDLLHVAFVLEDKSCLDHVVSLLPDDRVAGALLAAARHSLWTEAIDLTEHLGDEQYARVIGVAAEQDEELIDQLIAVAHAESLWPDVLAVCSRMKHPEAVVRAIMRAPAPAVRALLDAVDAAGAWDDVRCLLENVPAECRGELRMQAGRRRLLGRLAPARDLLEPEPRCVRARPSARRRSHSRAAARSGR